MNNEPVAWMLADKEKEHIRSIMAVQHDFVPEGCVEIPLYTHPAKPLSNVVVASATCSCGKVMEVTNLQEAKTLTDEEWNKAFDCYCETDEGVLRFDYELRDEWKKEQLIRWKEALRKAQEK